MPYISQNYQRKGMAHFLSCTIDPADYILETK
jgi:hypothetical protein